MTGALDPRFARPKTLFFGIGAQKAATTWLDGYLRQHPQVCLPVQKEQHYWTTLRQPGASHWWPRVEFELDRINKRGLRDRLLRGPRGRRLDRSWRLQDAMYRDTAPGHHAYADSLFQTWKGEPVVGEITPDYAYLRAEVFAEMAALAPDVRFLYVLRDPMDRLVSALKMSVRRSTRTHAPQIAERPLEARLADAAADPENRNLLLSKYDGTIRALESVVAPERIGYFFYETIFTQGEIDRLTDFLGVSRHPAAFDAKVFAADGEAATLDPGTETRLMAALSPTYAFVRARFGNLVPATWRGAGQDPALSEGAA